jgi:hypothetical protein
MLETSTLEPETADAVAEAPIRPRLLTFLCPPRSFSSVCSTMVGQHPDLYGFPELHLMKDDTIAGVLRREERRGKFLGPPGMLRAVAELEHGEQTVQTVFDAHTWLSERRHWPTKRAMDYVMDRVAETRPVQICVEKSPVVSKDMKSLNRLERAYPDGLYLHLTRHPLSNVASIQEFVDAKSVDLDDGWSMDVATGRLGRSAGNTRGLRDNIDSMIAMGFAYWVLCHTNILKFTRTIAPERVFRVKGEDMLSEPEVWLPRICRWAGIDDSPEAIDAMLHPETSPYAHPGPNNARGGNDGKFLRSPKLRRGRVKEGDLHEALAKPPLRDELTEKQKDYLLDLSAFFGYH